MKVRTRLTPHTFEYEEQKLNAGRDVNWVPYLMFFQPEGHRSPVVNTDGHGFRYSEYDGERAGERYSVGEPGAARSVRLVVGSSTVFGIGASSDGWTLSSRLTANDPRPAPWLNAGALAFNSAQELMLMTLYRHLLPRVDEIVLFSGFNNLALARLAGDRRLAPHGAFFNCKQYLELLDVRGGQAAGGVRSWFARNLGPDETHAAAPSVDAQIATAAGLTLRHLDGWRALARDCGARLTFVLQPLAGWVRARGAPEEEALFDELNQLGNFAEAYGDILDPRTCTDYAAALQAGANARDIRFVNFAPILADSLAPDQWLFVDRIHFTDQGHDFVARKLLEHL